MRINIFFIIAVTSVTQISHAWIYVDDTEEKVLQELGKPTGIFEMGDQKILSYKGGEVTIRNGKVIDVDLVSQNDQAPPKKPVPLSTLPETPSTQPSASTDQPSSPSLDDSKELVIREVKMRPGLSVETLLFEKAEAHIAALFLAERFHELEKISASLNHPDARNSDGTWKMTNFFRAILKSFNNEPSHYEKILAITRRWQNSHPSSMTARLVEAKILIDLAWEARGSGYANTVTGDGWKSFHTLLDAAHKVLIEAATLPGSNPEYYNVLLNIAHAQGYSRDEFEKIFDEAVSKWPSYIPYYEIKSYYLMPRWYGRKGELEKFFHEVYKTHPEGKLIYTKICEDHEGYYGSKFFTHTDFKWKLLKEAYEDSLKKYPDSNLILNGYAFMACIADDHKKAKELLLKIEGKYEDRIWNSQTDMEYYARIRRFYKIGR
ncbi:DUF4034 domain-containing protein [Oscillatoria laete-virens NRMC-F 0139]|nr:DUF4034 domain-containing protein [Oscillatoria laete-virens NRMC-F 0139]